MRRLAVALVLLVLVSCGRQQSADPQVSILVIGDSVLSWHAGAGASVADVIAAETGRVTANRAVSGARFSQFRPDASEKSHDIRAQYQPGGYDWVVLDGGANDLLSECGCRRCPATLDGMIGADGAGGDLPEFVARIRADGARVLLIGYYDGNLRPNPFTPCNDEIDALNARLARLADRQDGVVYVGADRVIDPANPTHWFIDGVHPSRLGRA